MIDWDEVELKDFGRVVTGKTPPTGEREYFDGEYYFVSPKDMDFDSRYIRSTLTRVTKKAILKFKNQVLPKNSVMFTSLSYGFGKIGLASDICLTNQQINSIIVDEKKHDYNFVYYLLRYSKDRILSYNAGIVTPIIPKSLFEKIKVFVPATKKLQSKIASILSAYDDLIENNLKRIILLEELAQRTYEEWFVKFRVNGEALEIDANTDLPVGWEKKKLTEIADIGFGFPFKANQFNSNKIGTPIIRIRNIQNSTTNDFTTEKVDKKYWVENGDLLVGMDGEFHINNWSGPRAYLVQRSCNIKARERIYHGYLSQAVVKPIKYFEATISGATVAHLGKMHLDTIEIIIPTEKFHSLITHFNNWLEQKLNLAVQNRYLKEARDILLPRLMNGTVNLASAETRLATKVIQLEAPVQKQATLIFKEAILISLLTSKFGSKKYPLGRMRYTKLSYLFHRHADNQIQDYLRKAAGPYNPKTKYGGPEKIAHDNGYVVDHKNGQLTGFIAGPNIEKAMPYFESYWNMEYLTWLETQFKYKSNDDLELFATVDNSLIELNKKNEPFTVETVKNILKNEPEWTAKLEREIFSDTNILRAVTYLPTIFQY